MVSLVSRISFLLLFLPTSLCTSSISAAASPTTAAPASLITPPPRIEIRDIGSVCGLWTTASAGIPQTWSWWCPDLGPCQIDTSLTPNLVFCTGSAALPYTAWFSYGSWPVGGCTNQQSCCPSDSPYPRTHVFNSGATIWCQCETESAPIYVTTSVGPYSVQLLDFTPPKITTTTSNSVTQSSNILNSLSPSTSSPTGSAAIIPTTGSGGTSNQSTPGGFSTGAKAGIGAGVGVLALLVLGLLLFWMKRKRNGLKDGADLQQSGSPYTAGYAKPELDGHGYGQSHVQVQEHYVKPELEHNYSALHGGTVVYMEELPAHREARELGAYDAPVELPLEYRAQLGSYSDDARLREVAGTGYQNFAPQEKVASGRPNQMELGASEAQLEALERQLERVRREKARVQEMQELEEQENRLKEEVMRQRRALNPM